MSTTWTSPNGYGNGKRKTSIRKLSQRKPRPNDHAPKHHISVHFVTIQYLSNSQELLKTHPHLFITFMICVHIEKVSLMPNEEVPIYAGRILTHAHSMFVPQAIYSTHLADYQNTLCASLPSNLAATSSPPSDYQTTMQPAHYSILRRAARPHLDPDMLMVCGASNNVGEYTRACWGT